MHAEQLFDTETDSHLTGCEHADPSAADRHHSIEQRRHIVDHVLTIVEH